MKKLRISKIWIAVVVIVIVAVAAWAMSGGKKEEDINFKEEKALSANIKNIIRCKCAWKKLRMSVCWQTKFSLRLLIRFRKCC